jgi:hypothetical protein
MDRRPDFSHPSGARDFDTGYFSEGLPILQGRLDKAFKERMTIHWARFEFRMELAAQEPGMIFDLDNLDEPAVGRDPAQHHALGGKAFAIVVVEFITMPVALGNLFAAIDLQG